MTRIQPECYIQVFNTVKNKYVTRPVVISDLNDCLKFTINIHGKTIALFLIKPTSIPLAERLEARRLSPTTN
jgi:hypothetical protein